MAGFLHVKLLYLSNPVLIARNLVTTGTSKYFPW